MISSFAASLMRFSLVCVCICDVVLVCPYVRGEGEKLLDSQWRKWSPADVIVTARH